MIISEPKSLEQILASIEGENKVFLIGCTECATVCQVGGEPQVLEWKKTLEENGHEVTGHLIAEPGCHLLELKRQLRARQAEVDAADGFLIFSCGTGAQVAAQALAGKSVHPATNTVFLGSVQRFGQFAEFCSACGDCILDITKGICPVTRCAKGLLNGPCGGTSEDGKCEVDPETDCAWKLIYDQLSAEGALDRVKKMMEARDVRRKPGRRVLARGGTK
ncbi:MAG: 5,10-methylenetetrahydrofolate reductase [Armatimonadetes bacterium]|nr:5,10-methylenetetrahydrofolate reductase [Armatimonadota bacterium]NIM23574.1 5,10-methylenetetrahydrofolate reductase [Armatimonadota bacterium]NIM67440.1 5,10-methylenetetrahydrofolate reductase [Armatimonadota bacterium]NIM75941.1 5,10-methylenetetrahydrofolate reductase [Armatimonadota bacterium]NIN05626.1 5,10-methylenetetrahydrofolate reductase [Armatimonadota bacterium]